jgi:hypothetical protein
MTKYYFKIKTQNTKYANIVSYTGYYNDDFSYNFLEEKVINDKK